MTKLFTVLLLSCFLLVIIAGCSKEAETVETAPIVKTEKSAETPDVEIAVSLGSAACMSNPKANAVTISIKNNGDTPIKKLEGGFIFSDSDKKEIARINKTLITKHPGRAEVMGDKGMIRYVVLNPGESHTFNFPFFAFFAGYPEMRESAKTGWGSWNVQFEITSILR